MGQPPAHKPLIRISLFTHGNSPLCNKVCFTSIMVCLSSGKVLTHFEAKSLAFDSSFFVVRDRNPLCGSKPLNHSINEYVFLHRLTGRLTPSRTLKVCNVQSIHDNRSQVLDFSSNLSGRIMLYLIFVFGVHGCNANLFLNGIFCQIWSFSVSYHFTWF